MEEDSSAKAAPVTRLRKRLSVEPEDSPLPTTPSTPSKKRGTRLAAKPQLELIDEVASENVPKRNTRKTTGKVVESDGTATPTSVTPSRRSTRVRSNTSLLSETIAQSVDSPRAKRALRRNSLLGSDNESTAPLTPARQTRRTRKDSTTSVKQATAPDENITVLTITTTETEEEFQKELKTNKDKAGSSSTRKSPRLINKSEITDETDNIHIETAVHSTEDMNIVIKTPVKGDQIENNTLIHTAKDNKTETEILSTPNANLINDMKTNDKKNTSLNKSTTSIDHSRTDLKNKRNRTKSWTTLTTSPLRLTDDKEDSTENHIEHYKNISGSGDGIQNSGKSVSKIEELEIKSPNRSINKSKMSLHNISSDNKENIVVSDKPVEPAKNDVMKRFENSPLNHKPLVFIEDSDSGSYDKLVMDIQIEVEDQCVPIGKPANQTRKDSFEAMDIDETMPENVTIDEFADKSNTSKGNIEVPDKRKSSISEKSLLNDKSMIKSKRKSSISNQVSDTPPRNSLNLDDGNKSNSKQLLENTHNSTLNTIDNTKSRKKSISCREEKMENMNESKRKYSVSEMDLETRQNESNKLTVKSPRKSSISLEDEKVKIDENINKSMKNVSMPQNYCEIERVEDSANNSQRKSSTSIVDDNLEKLYESCTNVSVYQNKSEIKQTEAANNKSVNKSRKASTSIVDDNLEKLYESCNNVSSSQNKSANKINEEANNNDSKNANKSKITSSNSPAESPKLEKSGNENKSTLVISQLRDVSTNDNNVSSPILTNDLSKSASGPEVKNKAIDKVNISPKNYLTSTPIQQKSLQKMALQINTSIISPAVDSKNVEKTPKLNEIEEEINLKNKAQSSSESSDEETAPKSLNKVAIRSQKKVPTLDSSESETETKKEQDADSSSYEGSDIVKNQQKVPKKQNNKSKSDAKKVKTNKKHASAFNDSDSEESEEEVSKDKNKMIDDEVSEASDDYESGDSRSDGEKQYEDENEIFEKGETLDSEEELSNDTDYERDSFIVSSDAEDNEMLSGTGDDLSMSDNELSMSAKSKKKFNERKLKQQKKASREMYESRHKNDSAASLKSETSKSKKSKRLRLESSTLESDNDSKEIKKNNRLRINSNQDSVDSGDESIIIKKKKSKRLSESVCETSMIEKEISLFNQTTEKYDPLTAAVKLEPKTPQKDFNISTVAINDNIEEVQVDSNASIMKPAETRDPLQASMAVDDDDEDSLSENNEIIENYDSVLSNLSSQTKKIKTHDSSLNLNKKLKNVKNLVIDQLNLTQTKESVKNKNVKNQHAESVKSKAKENFVNEEDDLSASIDMKLLFSENSNDSEDNAGKFKSEGNEPSEPGEQAIPLKRTEAKTNLLDKTDKNISLNESSLNMSRKKNKKRKTSQSSQSGIEEAMVLDNGIKIIVDTIGTHEEVDVSQASTNSTKKKNKKNNSLNETAAFEQPADIDCTDGFSIYNLTQVEASITSEKKKKKNKNKSFDDTMKKEGSHSEKKSRKISQSTSDFIETDENREETIVEEILVNTSIKSDKKKKNASVIAEPEEETQSAKKKSKKISISEENKAQTKPDETIIEEIPVNTSIKSEKKKKNKNASVSAEPDIEEAYSAKKKSKKISISEENKAIPDDSDDAPEEVSYKSGKKSDVSGKGMTDAVTITTEQKFKKNKKNKNKNLAQSDAKLDLVHASTDQEVGEKRKRKRQSSNNPTETDHAANVISMESMLPRNDKKKRKVNDDDDYAAAYDSNYQFNEDDTNEKKSKKNKSKKHLKEDVPQNNAKKRKNRDEDDSMEKISKVQKQDYFDEIHVPRLPETILKQLTKKPTKTKNLSAISTMPFIVEEGGRKNKPSEYLEQSVYLNNSPVKKKKQQKQMNPKVLPFIPTALTSDSGCTSRFNISLLPKDTQFVAQASNSENFKEAFLGKQRIKKMGTLERCKIQRSRKLSKF